jgi:hypothetical protein
MANLPHAAFRTPDGICGQNIDVSPLGQSKAETIGQ